MRMVFLILVLLSSGAHANEIRVETVAALTAAIKAAKDGDTIIVAPGRYDIGDVKVHEDVTIKGDGDVVFYGAKPVAKGLFNPVRDASVVFKNVVFRGAVSPDKNGAGIRHDGEDLTIVNCIFIDNENGVLATGDDGGDIIIQQSTFLSNGHGDGYSHGVYVVRARQFDVIESTFEGTKIGHHVKSLAGATTILNSRFDDRDGRPSYAVDASRGGAVRIVGNTIRQAANSSNGTIINYDLSRGGDALGLEISNNRIINARRNARLLRNAADLTPVIDGNEIINEGRGNLKP